LSEEIIKIILGTVIPAALGYAIAKLKHYNHERDCAEEGVNLLKHGMQMLLRDRLIQAYNHYAEDKQCCPGYAKDTITGMYNVYEKLGYNGVIDSYYKAMMALPNTKDGGDRREKAH
jgi:hypothetical protein